jgi:hypothetical protein
VYTSGIVYLTGQHLDICISTADRFYTFLWLLERKTCNDVRWCLRYMKGTIWWAFVWTNSRPVRGRLLLKHSSRHWMEGVFSINGFCVNVKKFRFGQAIFAWYLKVAPPLVRLPIHRL